MDINELKDTWSALDSRVKKTELLSDAMIREMTRKKASESTRNLVNYEVISISVVLMLTVFLAFMFKWMFGLGLWVNIFLVYISVWTVGVVLWGLYKLGIIIKVDVANPISCNVSRINKYNILVKRERLITLPGFLLIFILCAAMHFELNARFENWTFFVCLFALVGVIVYWAYKMIYRRNIESIIRSLDELKELEEKNTEN